MQELKIPDQIAKILESSMDGFWMVDLEGHIREVNHTYCRMSGYTREEVLSMSIGDFDLLESPTQVADRIRQITEQGQQRFETRHRRKDNSVMDVEVSTNFLDVNGGLIFAFFRDITGRKQAEELRRASEVRYRTLFNSANDALFVMEREKFVDCNAQAERLYGVGRDEIINRSPLDFSPSCQPDGRDSREKAGEKIHLALTQGAQTFEWQHCRNDGTLFDVEVSLNKMELAGGMLHLAVVRDITERKQAEAALRESEQKFRNIVETSPMGMHLYHLDSHDRLVFSGSNPAANQILNVDLDSYIGKTLEDAFPPLSHTEVPSAYRRVAREGGIWQTEQIEYKDDYISGAYEVYAFQTEPGAMAAMFLDITERKRTAEALRQSEAKLRSVFRAAPAGIGIVSDRILTLVNERLCRMLGYTADELIGKSARVLYESDDEFARVGREKYADIAEFGIGTLETRFVCKTGRVLDVLLSSSPINPDNLSQGVVFTALDISERKRTERALRDSEERFRAIFESAEDSIFIKNEKLQYAQVNPAMARLLNRRAEEIVGLTAQDIFDEEAGLRLSASDARVLNGEISANEFNYRIGSETRTFDIIKVPLRDSEGRVIGLCGINRDITDRKKAEEKMQAYQEQLRALSSELLRTEERERRHLASDLHDSICQYLALAQIQLSNLGKSATGREVAETRKSIHELLDLALTEARSLTNELSPPMLYHVGLAPALISLAEQMQKQYGLRIAVHCPDVLANIQDDDLRAALFRATRELLINIVKHAQSKRANVTLRQDGEQFQIEVSDTGVGFDFANIEKRKKQKGGFGLFSIGERLNHLGGNMEISSQPGKGTRVNISVPLSATQ